MTFATILRLDNCLYERTSPGKPRFFAASANTQRILSSTPHDEANEELDKISKKADREEELDENAAPTEEQKKLKTRRKTAITEKPATPEESKRLREQKERVQWVDTLQNNQLWERAHDPEAGLIVRVNSSHRFAKDMIAAVHGDTNLLKVLDVLFFALARAEFDLLYKSDFDEKMVEKLMGEYREGVGGVLSNLIRQLDLSQFLGAR